MTLLEMDVLTCLVRVLAARIRSLCESDVAHKNRSILEVATGTASFYNGFQQKYRSAEAS